MPSVVPLNFEVDFFCTVEDDDEVDLFFFFLSLPHRDDLLLSLSSVIVDIISDRVLRGGLFAFPDLLPSSVAVFAIAGVLVVSVLCSSSVIVDIVSDRVLRGGLFAFLDLLPSSVAVFAIAGVLVVSVLCLSSVIADRVLDQVLADETFLGVFV